MAHHEAGRGQLHKVLRQWTQHAAANVLPPLPVGALVRVTAKDDARWWAAIAGYGAGPRWVPADHLRPYTPDLEECEDYLELFQSAEPGDISESEVASFCTVWNPAFAPILYISPARPAPRVANQRVFADRAAAFPSVHASVARLDILHAQG